jgi:hypothetical protein
MQANNITVFDMFGNKITVSSCLKLSTCEDKGWSMNDNNDATIGDYQKHLKIQIHKAMKGK